jgi:hypothetical protein
MFGLSLSAFIVSSLIYALTLLALIFMVQGPTRRLIALGYGVLALFVFRPLTLLAVSLLTLALAYWARGEA